MASKVIREEAATSTQSLRVDDKDADEYDMDPQTSYAGNRPWILQPKVWVAIALGQFLALMIMASGITSSYIAQKGVDLPQLQGLLNYVCLALMYTPILIYQGKFVSALSNWGWCKYLLLGLVDVEANFMIVKAYQYASITSVQLLDNFTVPAVMVLSLVFLNMAYKFTHVTGACICVVGVLTLVVYDYYTLYKNENDQASNALLGDFLVLGAATLYAVSNVAQEFLIRSEVSVVEWLSMIGISGTIVGTIQFGVLEGAATAQTDFDWSIIGLFAGFTVSMIVFYSLVPVLIKISSATMLNLSLLTCDFYSVFAGVFLFGVQFTYVYAIAFLLSATGILVYNCVPEPEIGDGKPIINRLFTWIRRSIRK